MRKLAFNLIFIAGMIMSLVAALPALAEQNTQKPQDLTFVAKADGSTQRYIEILPQPFDPKQPHDLMIGLHGHGSDRMQYGFDARGECKGSRDVAAKHNMIFISPDYRPKTSWMGPLAEADMVQLIKDLKKKYKIRHVIVTGASMGGTSSLIFAVRHPKLVDGIVSENGMANMVEYDQFQDAIAESYGGSKKDKPEVYRERSAEFFPEKFKMPIAITAGGKDDLVPSASVMRLADAIKKHNPNVLVLFHPEGGHMTNYEDTVQATEFVIERIEHPKK